MCPFQKLILWLDPDEKGGTLIKLRNGDTIQTQWEVSKVAESSGPARICIIKFRIAKPTLFEHFMRSHLARPGRYNTKDVMLEFMQFFVPYASNEVEAESVYRSIAQSVGVAMPDVDRRIYRLWFTHNNHDFIAEVGKPMAAYYREGDQQVLAIFAGEPYVVCLQFRGVLRGEPILVGRTSVQRVDYFGHTRA